MPDPVVAFVAFVVAAAAAVAFVAAAAAVASVAVVAAVAVALAAAVAVVGDPAEYVAEVVAEGHSALEDAAGEGVIGEGDDVMVGEDAGLEREGVHST